MATRALYCFAGFPGQPDRHLVLHHDGYPTGAAWRFKATLQECAQLRQFPSSFRCSQPGGVSLSSPDQAADAEYRYRVEYICGPCPQLQVQAWRRVPESRSWMPRTEPMPIDSFIARFLPDTIQPDPRRNCSR
ncbi:MAG: hypothetical protein ACKO0M_13445 [Cyanobium sp.]